MDLLQGLYLTYFIENGDDNYKLSQDELNFLEQALWVTANLLAESLAAEIGSK